MYVFSFDARVMIFSVCENGWRRDSLSLYLSLNVFASDWYFGPLEMGYGGLCYIFSLWGRFPVLLILGFEVWIHSFALHFLAYSG